MTSTPTTPPEVVEQWRSEHKKLLLDTNEWCIANFVRSKDSGEYYDWKLEAMWQGFLLSRQTACIELPSDDIESDGISSPDYYHGFSEALCLTKEMLESQGYQVKVKSK